MNFLTELIIVALVGGGSSILVSILTNGVQLFKWKSGEKSKTNSEEVTNIAEGNKFLTEANILMLNALPDELRKVQEKLKLYEDDNEALQKRMLKMSNEQKAVKEDARLAKEENIILKNKLEAMDKKIIIFTNWAERLSHQVYSLGGTPVLMEIEQ